MATAVDLSTIDHSGEVSRSKFYIADLNAGNLAAQTTGANAIRSALEAITLCNEVKLSAQLVMHSAAGVRPDSVLAQRESVLRLFYVDTVNNRKGSMTIPGPDLTALTLVDDNVTLADASVMADLVTALETNALSRDGNAISVTHAYCTGRRD